TSKHFSRLTDLALELAAKSSGLQRSLPVGLAPALSDLVRSMNCYYSNLIEGHDTHPIDIERALQGDYSRDTKKRTLQLEAKAHIAVQKWIDENGVSSPPFGVAGLLEIHKRFCSHLPDALLKVSLPGSNATVSVVPGQLRTADIQVGPHIPISPGAVPRFMDRFDAAHRNLGKTATVIAAATAHHRLLWIHPFLDGNGRVARLMSYAALKSALETGGLWSIARGLARKDTRYKSHLIACDQTRRNDLDGRGHLSEECLAAFSEFFLKTCIDQVDFMDSLMQPNQLRMRILSWAAEEIRSGGLPGQSATVLEAILYRGTLPRAEVSTLLGTGDRQARRITAALLDRKVLASKTSKAPLRLTFPAAYASHWMPGLFPDQRDSHDM
ncbi:MAG: Fic family protein, partial [Rhodospirillaceae bacterium]